MTDFNYIVSYPPKTKNAKAVRNGHTLIVHCPHCDKKHYHPLLDAYKACVEAHCKQGYYNIKRTRRAVESEEK